MKWIKIDLSSADKATINSLLPTELVLAMDKNQVCCIGNLKWHTPNQVICQGNGRLLYNCVKYIPIKELENLE